MGCSGNRCSTLPWPMSTRKPRQGAPLTMPRETLAPRQLPRPATIENRRATAVIFFLHGIVRRRLDYDRIGDRINRSAYWKERAVVATVPEESRRIRIARKQRINATVRLIEKLSIRRRKNNRPGPSSVLTESERCNRRRHTRRAIEVASKTD